MCYRKYKLDPRENHRALTKLVLAAENCIHVLSTIESANCFVESLCEGVDFGHTMTRARFESLLFPFLDKFTRPIYTVLSRLNMTPDNVTTVSLSFDDFKGLFKLFNPLYEFHCFNVR